MLSPLFNINKHFAIIAPICDKRFPTTSSGQNTRKSS